MLRRLSTFSAGLLAFALVLVGCGGGGGDATLGKKTTTTAPVSTAAPATNSSYIATVKPAVTKIDVYDSPDAATSSRQFDNPWLYDPTVPSSKVPQVFLVKEQRPDGW